MISKKVLALALMVSGIMMVAPCLQAQDASQQKAQSKTQEQKKLQKKEQKQEQKREQKRLQKKEQKKLQKKEQKQDCSQQESSQGQSADKGQGKSEDKGQSADKGQAKAPEVKGTETKIEGQGVVVASEDDFVIEFGGESYVPLNLQDKYKVDGLAVDFSAEVLAGEDVADNSISILDISSEENLEEIPVASEKQAKQGQIIEEKTDGQKQQGKSKLTNDF